MLAVPSATVNARPYGGCPNAPTCRDVDASGDRDAPTAPRAAAAGGDAHARRAHHARAPDTERACDRWTGRRRRGALRRPKPRSEAGGQDSGGQDTRGRDTGRPPRRPRSPLHRSGEGPPVNVPAVTTGRDRPAVTVPTVPTTPATPPVTVPAIPLGASASFGVVAGAGVTNTGTSVLTGDIGSFPTPAITGLATLSVNGVNQAGGAVAQQAKTDLVTAYDAASAKAATAPIAADIGGRTLAPGVYRSASSIGLTGTVTLDGQGDPGAVFVFQAGSTLTTASASQVILVNGARSCNVFWQVGSSATLGTASTFRGTILALTSVTVTTGVTVDGRVLARNGAVTLDSESITRPAC